MTLPEGMEAAYRDRLARAAAALRKMQGTIDRLSQAKTESVAVIGMGCRFPGGANGPDAFWRLLCDGADTVSEVPAGRIDRKDAPGGQPSGPARWGAFLSDVDGFDAAFFGISPREAAYLDPQHRLLLEVAWEALEDAGIVPERLAGTSTGVFAGLTTNDYLMLQAGGVATSGYLGTGTTHCFAPGRLSYLLGLRGPSLAVDTACSSSLVAVHLAMQSLRSGESSLALAGGVNLMLSQPVTDMVAGLEALSPDGRCYSFDARANGFVRGEGCGFVVLKRLSDAHRDGDRVLAVLRGSAVNQDGHSSGLTAPNPAAQRDMLRQALASAGIDASAVGYVETHGTGTALGDPIEAEALADVLGAPGEDASPCVLGAVKTSIGHLEAAAGIAGLIKTVLVLSRGHIPANRHFRTLNPRIRLDGTRLTIAAESRSWPADGGPRVAGVSSFGMSGTNAHIIVEEAPQPGDTPQEPSSDAVLVPLSARSPEALTDLAHAWLRHFGVESAASVSVRDLAATAATRRGHHDNRLAVVTDSVAGLTDALAAFTAGLSRPGLLSGKAPTGRQPGVVFVFSGQGTQWAGMGRDLLTREPVFAEALRECDALIAAHAPFSVVEEILAPEESSRLHDTEIAQPALFATQIALADLLLSWGIEPDAVIGHSVGEVAAAHLAGALDRAAAARLAVLRGRVMAGARGAGSMLAVALGADDATELLAETDGRVSVAAINDGGSVVLSGETGPLEVVAAELRQRGIQCQHLRVEYPFHSARMAGSARDLAAWLVDLDSAATATAVQHGHR